MSKLKTIMPLLTAFLVSGCHQTAGDFCDIAEPIRFNKEVARAVVLGDRPAAEQIDVQNRYGEKYCGW